MAQEPCAFMMYKSRHFEALKYQPDRVETKGKKGKKEASTYTQGSSVKGSKSTDLRPALLQVANAKIIGPTKLAEIVEKATNYGNPLPNQVYNIPKNQE